MEKIDRRQGSLFFEILKVYEFLLPKRDLAWISHGKEDYLWHDFRFHFKFQGCRVYTPKVKLGSEKLRSQTGI